MRRDTANRAFLTLVAVALAPFLLLGVFGCGLLSYLAYRIAADGPGVLTADADLRPAAAFFAVVSVGTLLAVRSLWRQYRATRRLAEHVRANRLPSTADIDAASQRAGLASVVDVVDSAEAWSFTYGLRAPRWRSARTLRRRPAPTSSTPSWPMSGVTSATAILSRSSWPGRSHRRSSSSRPWATSARATWPGVSWPPTAGRSLRRDGGRWPPPSTGWSLGPAGPSWPRPPPSAARICSMSASPSWRRAKSRP